MAAELLRAAMRRDALLAVLGCNTLAAVLYAGAVAALWPAFGLGMPILAVFMAAAVSSIAGFAFSPIAAVMLVHLVDDPVRMVSMMLIASITIQTYSVRHLWRDLDWRGGLPFLLGGLATLPFGLLLLMQISGRGHALLLGTVLVVYGGWMLWRPPAAPRGAVPGWVEVLVGAASGVCGGLAGFPGGPVVVWCGLRGVGRVAARGLTQPFILLMQIAALLLLQVLDPGPEARPGTDPALLLVMAPALFGTLCGLALYERLSDRQFARMVNAMLLLAGAAMLM